jgi:hypothetical protein
VNGKWTNAVPLGGKVNTNLNEGAQNISQDGEWIIFTAVIIPRDKEAATCTFLTKQSRAGVKQKTLAPLLTLNFGNHPFIFSDKRDIILAAANPADMVVKIYG